MALSVEPAARATLPDLCYRILTYTHLVRSHGSDESHAEIRAKFEDSFRTLDRDGQQAGYSAANVRLVMFALVAFVDEMILLAEQWEGREAWAARPLQLAFFNTNAAGEEFYVRLAQVREALTSDPQAADVLECFALCLELGFQGKNGGTPALDKKRQDKLDDVIKDLASRRGTDGPICPDALSTLRNDPPPRQYPAMLVPLICMLVLFLVYIVMLVQLRVQAADTIAALERGL